MWTFTGQTSLLWIIGALLWTVPHINGQNTTETEHSRVENIAAARWKWEEFNVHITIMLFLLIMVLIKMAFRKIPYVADYVPESLVLIIVGIIFGAIVRFTINAGHTLGRVWILTPTLFFNYLLPPIVLESAYSLYNRTFSEYLGVVLIFAVLGTIFNFLIIGFAMYGVYKAGAMGEPTIHFDLKGFLLFSSLIVAVDPVAVLAIFQDIGVELSLYYIVFGESLLNDAITVVLYDIMSAFAGKDNVSGHEIGVGIASFFTVSFGGFLIGVIVGIISCLLTRIKSHLSAFIVILLAYFSYIITDCVGWSGIIGMIGCGLMQAAYAFHNLDHESVTLVHKFTKLVAEVSESVIFLYLGIEIVREKLFWHTGFMLWSLALCLIARGLVVLVITAIVNAAHLDGTKISFTEQAILIYGGLRGAVAFSLAVLIEERHFNFNGAYNRRLIITDTLFIILFTVGFMGMTMKPLVRLLKIRMQANEPLSLFGVLNKSMVDELMTGLEMIADVKGRNRVRDLFKRLDEKYFRHWFMRDPETYDEKLVKVYEKIALKLHHAQMQPNRRASVLADLPDTLRQRYLATEAQGLSIKPSWSDFDWIQYDESRQDFEKGEPLSNEASDFAQCLRSTHRATLIPNDKRQVEFREALQDMMRARWMSQSRVSQPRPSLHVGHTNLSFMNEEDEDELV
ncbi:Sodium/hydrogen exchanger [Fasciola hepatica]|uniref:Sodium/hydrogen exchanger n=1 Tax=Fasciola hepatica TaxID=6192 RepID=A0A4E0R8C7_FASHE|nr:Sodium/hydrogen exchanger [Fasciola hepatica]